MLITRSLIHSQPMAHLASKCGSIAACIPLLKLNPNINPMQRAAEPVRVEDADLNWTQKRKEDMKLLPSRVKYRKQQRGKMKGCATRGNYVAYGDYGLQSLETVWLSGRQIDAGRIAAQHFLRRQGKLYIRVFPEKPISKKPLETRMGTGKAEVEYWAACVKPGTILFEVEGVPEDLAKQALARVAHKMPIRCRMVARRLAV
jgi:large subunit ribosomal protein L16